VYAIVSVFNAGLALASTSYKLVLLPGQILLLVTLWLLFRRPASRYFRKQYDEAGA